MHYYTILGLTNFLLRLNPCQLVLLLLLCLRVCLDDMSRINLTHIASLGSNIYKKYIGYYQLPYL